MHNDSRPGGPAGSATLRRSCRQCARPRRPARAALLLLIALAGCGEGQTTPVLDRLQTRPAPAAPSPVRQARDTAASPPLVTVRDVIASAAFVGRRVRVIGRCLPSASEHKLGRLQRSLHEWQLEADGVAVFVIGPTPFRCASGVETAVMVSAQVAEDTLPAIGDLPPAPRRYLVLSTAWTE